MDDLEPKENNFIIYQNPNGEVKVDVFVENETVWLTQKSMGELFGVVKSTISEHLSNVFETNELKKEATVRNFRTVQLEGNREVARNLEFYNLDAIISVGYRVNSAKATQFRIWWTKKLQEYISKGFAMDDERLKTGQYFAKIILKNYWNEFVPSVPVNAEFISR